jgi:nicotinate-nucleotide pyrophosphorylase (carboxylating)
VIDEATEALITLALREDLGPAGDVTSAAVLGASAGCTARIVAREPIVLSGLDVARSVFARVDPQVRFSSHLPEGTRAAAGLALAEVTGPAASILAAERTALNFLQRLCGVATLTAKYVAKLEGTRCRLLDTRKTTPGYRVLEKAAVRAGGGHNHRMGLYDGVLIKDNHIAAAGGLRQAVEAARRHASALLQIEVEVDLIEQMEDAFALGVTIVLCDNFTVPMLVEAVKLRDQLRPGTRLEASGGVTLENFAEIAGTGVDFVSSGALTHSARAVDIGLDIG